MLGNETQKIPPMDPLRVSAAFEGAFRSNQKGGCPQVKINSTEVKINSTGNTTGY
jgi:hypothetical protein